MKKVSLKGGNSLCPQPLYLYGTYKEDGRANYGLFCWACYAAVGKKEKFVACIGQDKLTRDLIRKNKMFSVTAVTKELLSQADFCGCTPGQTVDKETVIPSRPGTVLQVPIPEAGQWTFEVKVDEILHSQEDENSEIYLCSIENVCADERLVSDLSSEDKMAVLEPVVTLMCKYFAVEQVSMGKWGVPMKEIDFANYIKK